MTDRPVATFEIAGRRYTFTLAEMERMAGPPAPKPLSMRESVDAAIRDQTIEALKATRGNVDAAAARVGVSRRTFYNHCDRHGITPATYREIPCAA